MSVNKTLEQLLARVNDGLVALDSDWCYIYVNERAARLLQREHPTDLIGKHIWTEYPEGVGQPFHQAYLRAMKTQQPVVLEEYYAPWDQWYENRIYPSPDGLTIYFTDITLRKQAEEAIAAQLHWNEQLLQTMQDGFILADTEGRIVDANPAYCQMVGYSHEQLVGMNIREIEVELSPSEIEQRIADMVARGGAKFETRHRHRSGEIVELAVSVTMTQQQDQPLVAAFVRDITEHNRAHRSLHRAHRALKVLTSGNEAVVRAVTESELLAQVCRVVAEVGEYPLAWIGYAEHDEHRQVKPMAAHGTAKAYLSGIEVSWGDDESGRGPTGTAVRTGQTQVIEDTDSDPAYQMWRESGRQFGFRSSIALPLVSADTTYGILNIYSGAVGGFDTEEKRLLHELADNLAYGIASLRARSENTRLQHQLEQARKMEAIGELTGGVAHDFNNILVSIMGYSDLALEAFGEDMPTELVGYLEAINRAGGRARDLTSQLLAFSRTVATNPERITLEPVVREVVKLMRSTLPSSINLTVEVAPGIANVLMDPLHMHQIVMNLCINARDAVAGEGAIEVALRMAPDTQFVCASCHEVVSGEFVELVVRNNGRGMDPTIVERVFDPFFSTKKQNQGTGMGLSTVHGLVHEHGGHIRLETRLAGGTTFHLLFSPLSDADRVPVAKAAARNEPAPDRLTGRILVVDDDESVAMYVSELLRRRGCQVTEMTSSPEALALFERQPQDFDLVVTDQTMPDLTGADLARKILGLRPETPIVLCTGFSDKLDEQAALNIGIRCFLQKPVAPDRLLASIGDLLPGPQEP